MTIKIKWGSVNLYGCVSIIFVVPIICGTAIGNFSNTTLHLAAKSGDLDAVKFFIERGDDVNEIAEVNSCNCTPLVIAGWTGDQAVIKYLLDHKADVKKTVNYSTTHESTTVRKIRVTPLLDAVGSGQLEIAKLLIEKGADVSAADGDNWNMLFYATMPDSKEVIDYVLNNQSKLTHTDRVGNTALHIAILFENLNAVTKLIDAGVDINKPNYVGETPLYTAVEYNQLAIADLLLKKGADITKYDSEGHTPLHKVVTPPFDLPEEHRVLMINVFIKHRKDFIDIRSYDDALGDNKTALHFAVENNQSQVVKALRDAGADVNSRTGYHLNTPLHLAAIKNELALFKYLLTDGGSFGLKNKDGKTPLELLDSKSLSEIDSFIDQKASQSVIPRIG